MRGRLKKGREGREKLACERALRGDLAPKRPGELVRKLEKSVKQRGNPFLLSPVPSPSFLLPLSTPCSSLVQRLKFDSLNIVNSWTDFVCSTHTRRHGVHVFWRVVYWRPLFDFLDSTSSGINFIFTRKNILCKDNVIWLSSTVTY